MGDAKQLAISNRQFHDTLYLCSHNRYLVNMLTVLYDALSLLGSTMLGDAQRAEETLKEHRAIVNAIRDRDPDKAEAAIRAHIQIGRASCRERGEVSGVVV